MPARERIPQFDDPAFWDRFFELAATSTTALKVIAEDILGVDFDSLYARMRRNPELKGRYDDACKTRAQLHAAKVGDVLDKLENDPAFDTSRARELMKGHQWLASKLDRESFGDDKAPLVQVNFDSAGLNALRQLANAPLPAIEGEFTEVAPERGGQDLDKLLE